MRSHPPVMIRSAPATADTLEEERREVLASVVEALCAHAPDPDEMAACAYLVRHLAAPGRRTAA